MKQACHLNVGTCFVCCAHYIVGLNIKQHDRDSDDEDEDPMKRTARCVHNCCFIHCILMVLQSYRKLLAWITSLSLRVNSHASASCLRRSGDMTMITRSLIIHQMQVIPFHWPLTCSRNGLRLWSVFFHISYQTIGLTWITVWWSRFSLNFSSTKHTG